MELNKFLYNENIINFFPNYPEHNEMDVMENKDDINHKCQYYLFIVSILENILENKEKSEEFIEKIKTKKNITKLDIKSLIIKLYKLAYRFSGEKQRDFPYFSYYNFLINIDLDELKLLSEEFTQISHLEQELYEIYGKIVHEKEMIISKKLQKQLEKQRKEQERKLKEMEKEKEKEKDKEFEEIDKKQVKLNEHKPNFITSISEFNVFVSYPINTGLEFEYENKNYGFNYVIENFAEQILNILPKKQEVLNMTNQDIILTINKRILENKKIFEFIGQLKYIYPEKLNSCKERICFWANSFNFLIIFTIFYKKWSISSKDDWKYFFQKVKYLIGDKYYTFNDIQYLLYKRLLFFQSSYKINEDIKKFRTDKTDDAKNVEKKYSLLFNPFIIYLPIKDFIKPIILESDKLEVQMNERIKQYLTNYISVDKDKIITIPELLNNYQPRFICKEFKKFQSYMNDSIYNLLKEKKYKGNNVNYYEWKLDFDGLLNN